MSECEYKLLTRIPSIRAGLAGCATPALQEGYIAVLARRVAVDLWRRDLRQRAATVKAVTARDVSFPRVEPRESDIDSLLSLVKEPHRTVLRLRFVDELSTAEIAHTLDVPYPTAASRIHRALRRLERAALQRAEENPPM